MKYQNHFDERKVAVEQEKARHGSELSAPHELDFLAEGQNMVEYGECYARQTGAFVQRDICLLAGAITAQTALALWTGACNTVSQSAHQRTRES